MKKVNYGNFTKNAGKVLKSAERVFCAVDEENNIYISNAYMILKMNPAEYNETIRPAIPYDPGFWTITKKEKMDALDNKKFIDLFNKTVTTISGEYMEKYPGIFPVDIGELVAYYNKKEFVSVLNNIYISCLSDNTKAAANSPKDMIVFYDNDSLPIAIICPIRPKDNVIPRAVISYFKLDTDKEESSAKNENIKDSIIELKKENSALREVIETKEKEIAALRDELQKAKEEKEKKEESAKEESIKEESVKEETVKDKIAKISATFAAFDGIKIIVKGAQTNTPVLWIDGNIEKHKNDIIKAGAIYSNKRAAYYVRIA